MKLGLCVAYMERKLGVTYVSLLKIDVCVILACFSMIIDKLPWGRHMFCDKNNHLGKRLPERVVEIELGLYMKTSSPKQ
jgi:hypothetical protein